MNRRSDSGRIAFGGRKPPLWLSAARNYEKPHLGDSSNSSIPHEMNELRRLLFRAFGTALAQNIRYVRQNRHP
jgi:hypothetical protein